MAEVIVITSRVLTPEQAEARRKRVADLIEEAERRLLEKEDSKEDKL
jgi:hypothetical protein